MLFHTLNVGFSFVLGTGRLPVIELAFIKGDFY